jgi:tetratricopeptide (TPR) repeat protein
MKLHLKSIVICLTMVVMMAGCASSRKTTPISDSAAAQAFLSDVQAKSARLESATVRCPSSNKAWQGQSWKKLMSYANACTLAHNDAMVESIGNEMATSDPLSPWGPYYLSLAAQSKNDLPRALWMADLATKKASKSSILIYQKARVLFAMDDTSNAVESFRRVLQIDPNFVEANLALGHILYREQYLAEALPYFEKALQFDQNNFQALVAAAQCREGKNDFTKASEYWIRAQSLEPQKSFIRLKVADLQEQKLQDYSAALSSYRELKTLAKRQRLDQKLTIDVDGKIHALELKVSQIEAVAAQSGRNPSSQDPQKRVTK